MEYNACGTLAYAGFSAGALLACARTVFAQAQPAAPERFDAFLPLFPAELTVDMEYTGTGGGRNSCAAGNGFSIDPAEYFAKLYTRMPELYAGENALRNFTYEGHYVGRGVFTVDAVWADRFPQYRPFMGEKLAVYLIGGGSQATAVPESVYPRGGGVLKAAEEKMGVAERAGAYVAYAVRRMTEGELYDAEAFGKDYLRSAGLAPLAFGQRELERAMQDLSVVKSLQSDRASVGHYTENARRAGRVTQYVPMRYACDRFVEAEADKRTSWLMQPYWQDGEFIGDLWIPYPDFFACVDKHTMTLDVRRLCEAYQIAPRYDPETGGGCYPDAVRVASVRDREYTLLVGETINNPAYGDGQSAEAGTGALVFIADSREMIRQHRMVLERASIACENRAVPPEEYRRMLALAALQEHKGRLTDAMYRCETALRQIDPGAPVYEKARALLTERVDKLDAVVTREAEEAGDVRPSGYDADIAYLREVRWARESADAGEESGFVRDARREESIEGGYAMRAGLLRLMYADAALPLPPEEQDVGADDSEDEAEEPLPPIPADSRRKDTPKPDAVPAARTPSGEPQPNAETTPEISENGEQGPETAPPQPETGETEPTVQAPPEETDEPPRAGTGEPETADEPGDETDAGAQGVAEPENGSETAQETEHGGGGSNEAAPAPDGEGTPPAEAAPTQSAPRRGPVSLRELAGKLDEKAGSTPAAHGNGTTMAEWLQKHGGR